MKTTPSPNNVATLAELGLQFLTLAHIKRIDHLLAGLGGNGEVRLVVQNGELRYLNELKPFKSWDDQEQKPTLS